MDGIQNMNHSEEYIMGQKDILSFFFETLLKGCYCTKSIQMVILAKPWEDFFLMSLLWP